MCETQKNGNLHFHILVDIFLPKNDISIIWYKHLKHAGYIYINPKTGQESTPPASKIESPKSLKSIQQYLLKYILKGHNHRKLEGRIWFMSSDLRQFEPYISLKTIDELINCIGNVDCLKNYIVYDDFQVIIFFNDIDNFKHAFREEFEDSLWFFSDLYKY